MATNHLTGPAASPTQAGVLPWALVLPANWGRLHTARGKCLRKLLVRQRETFLLAISGWGEKSQFSAYIYSSNSATCWAAVGLCHQTLRKMLWEQRLGEGLGRGVGHRCLFFQIPRGKSPAPTEHKARGGLERGRILNNIF